ncbi:MAG: hypothetical protein ACREMY_12415 [bacterium]
MERIDLEGLELRALTAALKAWGPANLGNGELFTRLLAKLEAAPKIARAAHLFGNFEPSRAVRICEEEGISDAHIEAGAKLADERAAARIIRNELLGDPAWGGRR